MEDFRHSKLKLMIELNIKLMELQKEADSNTASIKMSMVSWYVLIFMSFALLGFREQETTWRKCPQRKEWQYPTSSLQYTICMCMLGIHIIHIIFKNVLKCFLEVVRFDWLEMEEEPVKTRIGLTWITNWIEFRNY